MFVTDATVEVRTNGKEKYFYYKGHDLDEDSLFLPTTINGMLGTVELTRNRMILHPQDGDDVNYSVDDFLDFVGNGVKHNIDDFLPP